LWRGKEAFIMAVFYDPKDERDLGRVKRVLERGGIEYSLRCEPERGIGPMQVLVAEEDIPRAEELLWKDAVKREPVII
jgi:hypothetical protein